ncbi:unnamed protein product, partial [Tetraodon nigroviridis]
MESGAFAALPRGDPLPLASLRLLVPPLQLMLASMWQVLRNQDFLTYWTVAEYVSLVADTVPDLLMHKHRLQLLLGLRARYILELCRNEQLMDRDLISSHLEKMKSCHPALDAKGSRADVVDRFLELIQALLRDPEAKQSFFAEVLPAEYGAQYDSDLQTLFAEFVFRLNQLLPVPDMEQTVSWLGNKGSLLGDCERSVSEPADLIHLLQHHKSLGHFEQHVPPSGMGDGILSTLSAVFSRTRSNPPQGPSDHPHVVSFVDDVAVEVVTVTDYSEVELSTSADKEEEDGAAGAENGDREGDASSSTEGTAAAPPFEDGEEGKAVPSSTAVTLPETSRDGAPPGSSVALSGPKCSFHPTEERRDEDLSAADEEGGLGRPDREKSFRFGSRLKAHGRVQAGEQPFLCPQCGRSFSFKRSLERHQLTHRTRGGLFRSLAVPKEHPCSECGRAFAWKSALARHLKTHGGEASAPAAGRKCPHCELVFGSAGGLRRHLRSHGERTHACSCGKSFPYRAALTAHQRTHQKERPHVCAQCGKGFLYRGGLLSHMKIHSEEMPFMCSFCGKSFKRERNMKKHERRHTGENVFRCSRCDKSFVYKATLIRHELTHSGERPYLCSDCGKGFFSHAELLKHERFHTGHKPFQCPDCGKKFTQSCYLTVHLRYHTGARPYSCAQCDKRFLSANRLKRHQRTHTGERPYLCVECGKGFRQSYNLKTHQRTHRM